MRGSEQLSSSDPLKDFASTLPSMSLLDLQFFEQQFQEEVEKARELVYGPTGKVNKFRLENMEFRLRQLGLVRQEIKKKEIKES